MAANKRTVTIKAGLWGGSGIGSGLDQVLADPTHGPELVIALIEQLLDGMALQLRKLGLEHASHRFERGIVIGMSAPGRFFDDLVDEGKRLEVGGRHLHGFRRIGRTGRAGRKGIAVAFVTPGDTEMYFDLNKFLVESKAQVPPELARHEAAKIKPGQPGERRRDKVIFAKK